MGDEIMAEVWHNRDEFAAKYGHDLDRIVATIRRRERRPLTGMCVNVKPQGVGDRAGNSAVPHKRG